MEQSRAYLEIYVTLRQSEPYNVLLDYQGIYKIVSLPVEGRLITPVCWFNDLSVDFLNVHRGAGQSEFLLHRRAALSIFKKYNLIVKVYAVNDAAYAYWLNNQELRQTKGDIFDPVPSEINGNITSESGHDVLGYFTLAAGTMKNYPIDGVLDLPIMPPLSECYRKFLDNDEVSNSCFDCRLLNPLDTLPPPQWIEP